MFRKLMLAAAALTLAACNQGSGPALPKAEEGAINAPSELQSSATQHATVTPEVRAQLEQQIGEFLTRAQEQLAQGYTPSPGLSDEVAGLQAGTDHRWEIALKGGADYRIVGACDGDCTNLDIELIDQQGHVVASDVLPDDFPVVSFKPAQNGRYFVRIMMQACSVSPCYAGARVLQTS